MFMNPSFLFDMMCTAVWLGLAVHYARKGLLAALVQIVGSLFSLIGAQQAAAWGSGALFDRFLAGSFRERIAVSLSAGGAVDLAAIAERYAGFLPEPIRRQVVAACEQALAGLLTDNVLVMADTIVQEVIRPLLTPVFSVVLFFLCFAALRMVISLLVTVLGLVNRLPVLGAVAGGRLSAAVRGVGADRHHRRQPARPQRTAAGRQYLLPDIQPDQPVFVRRAALR